MEPVNTPAPSSPRPTGPDAAPADVEAFALEMDGDGRPQASTWRRPPTASGTSAQQGIDQCAEIAGKKNVPQWQVVHEAIARYHRQVFRA